MSFRSRLRLGFLVAVLGPLSVFAFGVRREMERRLTAQYETRVSSLLTVIDDDLAQRSEMIAERLTALKAALLEDNRFRLAALQGASSERPYLIEYAGRAMRLGGLAMLQIQDEDGRILSSGHFRNEYDGLEPGLPVALAASGQGLALVRARAPDGPFLALARIDSLRLGGRRFTIIGGLSVDRQFLSELARGQDLAVSLLYPGGALASGAEPEDAERAESVAAPSPAYSETWAREIVLPYIDAIEPTGSASPSARIVVSRSLAPLRQLQRGLDAWFALVAGVTAIAALLVAGWLSSRIHRPIRELAEKTSRLDLERLEVDFASDRRDELGALSRLLQSMTERLRAGAARLREAERRATIGELARQVNHDIKNGLVPIRNVLRHLSSVAQERPDDLTRILRERQGTLESSLRYLDTLATNYARLSPRVERGPCDLNDIVRQVVPDLRATGRDVHLRLAEDVPAVLADPVVLRRILENLVANAVQSLDPDGGMVSVSTERNDEDPDRPRARLSVRDTGRGMTPEQLAKAFEGFYSTKEGGTGLGLTIVRRLILDLDGALKVETQPGAGSRFIVDLPAAEAPTKARRSPARSGSGGVRS